MSNWRPPDWHKYEQFDMSEVCDNKDARLIDIFEAGADAMYKAKEEARRPVKEVRLKLIDVDWGDMSMSEFVDWMYGEV